MANWERKSSYLLREIVKFRTYIDSLTAAHILKEKIYAEREAEAAKNEIHGNENIATKSTAIDTDGGITATRNSELIAAWIFFDPANTCFAFFHSPHPSSMDHASASSTSFFSFLFPPLVGALKISMFL